MLRERLKRLERLVQAAAATCPGCVLRPAIILMPGDPEPTKPWRCGRCGREHQPAGVRFVVPGLSGPLAAAD